MQGYDKTVVVLKCLLDVIEDVMAVHGVGLGGHLHVRASELTTGTIVMDHEIMGAQHAGIAHDFRPDVRHKLGVRRRAKQRINRVAKKLYAAPCDICPNSEARPCIELERGNACNHC